MADSSTIATDIDLVALCDLLVRRGHVRGKPVAISLFRDEVPEAYHGRRVEPCAIVHHAMDLGETVYVDAEFQDCLAGAWQAGFLEPPLAIRDGSYLSDGIPGFLPIAAQRVKTGENVLPQGTARAIGAAPLDAVPDGVTVDSIVIVCEPVHAATIAGVRTTIDGTPPRGAAGTSLCGELFAIPWHDDNVILTPGDMGGRMFNKTRPSEMFVIIPLKWAAHLPAMMSQTPDVPGLMESIKPGFLAERAANLASRQERREASSGEAPAAAVAPGGIATSMPWDEDCLEMLRKAPDAIREFAGPLMEEYADEHGHDRITMAVMAAQMDSVGMRLEDVLAMLDEDA